MNLGQIARSPAGMKIWAAGEAYHAKIVKPDPVTRRSSYTIVSKVPFGPLRPIRENWAEFVERMTSRRKTMAQIIREVCEVHGVSRDDLLGPSRFQKLVNVRQEAMYRSACETDASLPMIGQAFGGRDHTTALHSIKAHAHRYGLPLPRGMEFGSYLKKLRR